MIHYFDSRSDSDHHSFSEIDGFFSDFVTPTRFWFFFFFSLLVFAGVDLVRSNIDSDERKRWLLIATWIRDQI